MGIFEQAQNRAKKIAAEQEKRYEEVAEKILEVVIQEAVTVKELPLIVSILTGRINAKFDEAKIDKILNLNEKDDKA